MCGIAGIFSKEIKCLSDIQPLTEALKHRGPDGEGFAVRGHEGGCRHYKSSDLPENPSGMLALGHRRLSIIDTSDAGHQPMASQFNDTVISYNGEVYNYLELRAELEQAGVRFLTQSDTEVVLEAYRYWGTDCFARFNGMWAMAIWDERHKQLILSRDRFGIKPLNYLSIGSTLYFSSELKSLLCLKEYQPKLNKDIAADFLRWGIVSHTNGTFFRDISTFPAGCFCVIDPQKPTAVSPQKFWAPKADRLANSDLSLSDAEAQFRSLFSSSVALRLRADVPVGACLSGGLDSSAIVYEAVHSRPDGPDVSTFTSASSISEFDERKWSDLVNQACHTTPHTVFPEPSEFLDDLDHLILAQEEPFPSASIYAQFLLMKKAREEQIPVLLDGQGADEALCGYRKYVAYSFLESFQEKRWLDLLGGLAGWIWGGDKGLLQLSQGVRYLPKFLRRGDVEPLRNFVRPGLASAWDASRPGSTLTTYRSSERQIDDLLNFSVPALLRYEDRNSMAWSVESRVPFLDYRLIEFLLELPTSLKVRGGQTKTLMRGALKGQVAKEILQRRDKMGFVTPMHEWMQNELRSEFADAFASSDFRLASLIDPSGVASLLDTRGPWSWAALNAVFRVFILDRWARLYGVTVD